MKDSKGQGKRHILTSSKISIIYGFKQFLGVVEKKWGHTSTRYYPIRSIYAKLLNNYYIKLYLFNIL
jgi:hypothetical protein